MQIIFLTLFPEYFHSALKSSILKRAQTKGLVSFKVVDIRDFATDKYQTTDDRPFGGGPGMVMKVEPIDAALKRVVADRLVAQASSSGHSHPPKVKTVLTSAKGKLFTQQLAQSYAELDELVIICGHYEGVDERVTEHLIDEEVRIGNYVLTGGEPAALVMSDAVTRLIKGVLGNEESNLNESHSQPGRLGYPQYTRPEEYQGWSVPPVLLSGNHTEVAKWRAAQIKVIED